MRLTVSLFIFILLNEFSEGQNVQIRTFVLDTRNNVFLKDGKPFQVISGEFEYFRAHPGKWRSIFRLMRAAGLNTLSMYVDWTTHNPEDGEYVWTGIANVEQFVQLAAEEDLLVVFRVGPYISAEINGGGHPYWLLEKYPKIAVRTLDPDYMREVHIWFSKLLPRFVPYLYKNGGPIIIVQVENQYGQFGCNANGYLGWMRDLIKKYTAQDVVLITNNLPVDEQLACTKVEGLTSTIDFKPDPNEVIQSYYSTYRKYHPLGPLMVTEFYTEWTPIWGQRTTNFISSSAIADNFRVMLRQGVNVNFYIFYAGTSFGLTSGTSNIYGPFTTSYGNGGPIAVTGAVDEKYFAIRNIISEFYPLPNTTIPPNPLKMTLPPIQLQPITTLFSSVSRRILSGKTVSSKKPLTFEQLPQNVGFVLYETALPKGFFTPFILSIPNLFGRAYVYVDNKWIALLTSTARYAELYAAPGRELQILIENPGRLTANIYNRTYGINGDAFLNGMVLNNWNITGFPFAKLYDDPKLIELLKVLPNFQQEPDVINRMQNRKLATFGTDPIIFKGLFDINQNEISDTFIDPTGWGKGFIYVNGFNLGRYWPLVGPQITLYVPKEILLKQGNIIVVVELETAPINNVIRFSGSSIFRVNGTIVYDY